MKDLSASEQKDINSVPILELDRQVMLGVKRSVYINDGLIIGTSDEE